LPLTSIAEVRLPRLFMPPWASLLRWQVSLLLVVLAVLPTIWAWNTPVRRLPGPAQLSANLQGMLAAAVVLGVFGFLLSRAAL
jgi:lipid A ethanolaminephosphotransferase